MRVNLLQFNYFVHKSLFEFSITLKGRLAVNVYKFSFKFVVVTMINILTYWQLKGNVK